MLKVNLLPAHIVESRRIKASLRVIIAGLVILTALLAAYVWAPAPFSLSSRKRAADERLAKATVQESEVLAIDAEAKQVEARYAEKNTWVMWVEEADRIPAKWRRWYNLLNKYVPADVVVSALPAPSTTLSFTGYTSDLKAAARWYLNMWRCEMVNPALGEDAVRFSTPTVGWPGERPTGPNPKMQQQVSITIGIRPEFLDMLVPPPMPATAGATSERGPAAAGRMGAAGGAARRGRGGTGGMMGAGRGRRRGG